MTNKHRSVVLALWLTACLSVGALLAGCHTEVWQEAKIIGINDDRFLIEVNGEILETGRVEGLKLAQISLLFGPADKSGASKDYRIRARRRSDGSYWIEVNGKIQPQLVRKYRVSGTIRGTADH